MAPNYKFFHDCFKKDELAAQAFVAMIQYFIPHAIWRGYSWPEVVKAFKKVVSDEHPFLRGGNLYCCGSERIFTRNASDLDGLISRGDAWVPFGYTQNEVENYLRRNAGLRRPDGT